jgi:hypothetical protein
MPVSQPMATSVVKCAAKIFAVFMPFDTPFCGFCYSFFVICGIILTCSSLKIFVLKLRIF